MVLDFNTVGLKFTAGGQSMVNYSFWRAQLLFGAVAAGESQSAVPCAFLVDCKAAYRALQSFESSDAMTSKPRTGTQRFYPSSKAIYPPVSQEKSMKALTKITNDRVARSTTRRVNRKYQMRKWRAQKNSIDSRGN